MNWADAAARARQHLGARKRKYPEAQCLALIDFFAEHGTVTKAQMLQHGPTDCIRTILSNVTTPIHGGGSVPLEGGWYRKNAAGTVYVIDPGFAEAWKASKACDAPSA